MFQIIFCNKNLTRDTLISSDDEKNTKYIELVCTEHQVLVKDSGGI